MRKVSKSPSLKTAREIKRAARKHACVLRLSARTSKFARTPEKFLKFYNMLYDLHPAVTIVVSMSGAHTDNGRHENGEICIEGDTGSDLGLVPASRLAFRLASETPARQVQTGVTRADEKQRTWRIPAGQLEGAIAAAVQNRITQLSEAVNIHQFPGAKTLVPDAKAALSVVEGVGIATGQLTVDLNAGDVQKLIGAELDCDPSDLTLDLPFTERRRGVEMKLVVGNGAVAVDKKLLNNIIRANHWYQRLKGGQSF